MSTAFLIQAFVMDGGVVSVLQRRKLEPPGAAGLAQGHRGRKWWSVDLDPADQLQVTG